MSRNSDIEEGKQNSYKTIVIGNSDVGKSTLLVQFIDGKFSRQIATVGLDYHSKKVQFNSSNFTLELWDSAGQERYRTIVKNYFNASKAALVVFDLTKEQSLDDAKNWLEELSQRTGNEIPKLLLGSKCDLLPPEELKQTLEKYNERINKLKAEYNCQFFVVSGKTGHNVTQAFNFLVKSVYKHYIAKNIKDNKSGIKLEEIRQRGKTNGKNTCC